MTYDQNLIYFFRIVSFISVFLFFQQTPQANDGKSPISQTYSAALKHFAKELSDLQKQTDTQMVWKLFQNARKAFVDAHNAYATKRPFEERLQWTRLVTVLEQTSHLQSPLNPADCDKMLHRVQWASGLAPIEQKPQGDRELLEFLETFCQLLKANSERS